MKTFRKITALLLAVIMVIAILPVGQIGMKAEAADLYSKATVKITYSGQVVDSFHGVDSAYIPGTGNSNTGTYCCAQYVKNFYSSIYGVSVWGLTTGSTPSASSGSFSVTSSPRVGDIGYHTNSSGSGHWFILKDINSDGTYTVIEQNWKWASGGATYCYINRRVSSSSVNNLKFFRWSGGWAIDGSTTPPTNPKLTIYTKGVAVGESILFEYSVDNATNMYIPIDVDGVREHFIEVSGDHYNATFSKPGNYSAALYATNAYGDSGFSNWVNFLVYDSKPSGAWMYQNKDAVKVGEEISFNYNATNATGFTLGIDKVGVGRVRTVPMDSDWYTTTFDEPGIYTIYAQCYNSLGSVDSFSTTFTVYQDIGTNFTAPILNKGHWKIIENDYKSGSNGKIQIADETGTSDQLWYFERQTDGSYIIFSCYDGMCLDVKNASSDPEATVWTCEWNGTDAQRWYIWEESGGYVLKPKCSNYVLDLCDNDSTNGTGVQTYIKNNTSAQIWAIYKGDECKLSSPKLSVTAGKSATKTKFSWTDVYGETRYDLKIWKNSVSNSTPYHTKQGVDNEYSVQLPAGTYQAYVEAVNYYQSKRSDIVTFTVDATTYTVKYNANGGSGAPGNQTKVYGTDLTLSSTKPTKSFTITYNANGGSVSPASKTVSATFNNWKATDGTTYNAGGKYTANSATTLTAQWTNPTAGDLATPTRTGYTFNGWYTAASGGTKVTSSSTISANTTLYAQWTQIKYTVSYNANGGSGAPGNQTKVYGTDLTLSSTKPTKSYTITYNANGGSVSPTSKTVSATFKNWNTAANGSGTSYASGAKYTANAAATLYAQWTNPTAGDLPTPTRTGYTFNGWYTATSGGTKVTSTSTITANTTLYAQWTQIKYTVSYNANGGTGAPGNQTKVYGTDLTLSSTKPTKSFTITYNANGGNVSPASKTVSATFNNWKATDGTAYNAGGKYTANSATTLTAQWTNPTAGDLATPTRTGYTFNGWYTAASGGTKVTSSSTISANTTLYAQWTQIKYTVSYNANGGSGAPGNQTKVYGTDLTLSSTKPTKSYTITYNANGGSVSPTSKTVSATFNNWKATDGTTYNAGGKYTANSATTLTAQWTNPTAGDLPTPTRTGYTFNGWYTAASGGTKVTSSSTISANTTLYAQWTQIKYTVSYNANDGTGAPGNQTKVYGTDLTLSSTKPTKSYTITYNANGGSVSPTSKTVSATFNNWKATDGTTYNAGGKYTANSATTLTAQWTNPTAGDLATPTRTGYTFNGWYTAASGGTKVTSSSTISANTTLYAQWKINSYVIKYDANGGTGAPSSQTKTFASELTLSDATPTKTGYKLVGWTLRRDADNCWYVSGKGWFTESEIANNGYNKKVYTNDWSDLLDSTWVSGSANGASFTFFAQWTQNTYTVNYNANGGTGAPGSQTKTQDTDLTLSSTKPSKTYTITYNANGGSVSPTSKTVSATFKNWNTAQNGSGTYYAAGAKYTANAGATLYAQWTNPTAGDLPTPTRTGYTFNGWYTAASGGNKITSSDTISSDITLHAQWEEIVVNRILGDINNDGFVNAKDNAILSSTYGGRATEPNSGYNADADINGDGFINAKDRAILIANFGKRRDTT